MHRPLPADSRRDFLRRAGGAALAIAAGALAPGVLSGCAGGGEARRPSAAGPRADRIPPPLDLLPAPDLSDSLVIGAVAGLRPYRRGGVRLELDSLPDGRPLVHDYGHGGAGLTLSWGCAEVALDLLRPALPPPAEVAVLGAGIVGLTAASVLAEAGYRPTVYAEEFPPATTSDIAGGQWSPSLVDIDSSLERRTRFEWILRRSYARFAAHGARYGVMRRDNFATAGHGGGLSRIPAGLFPPPERLERLPLPGPARPGVRYRTLLIEPPVYLPRLVADLDGAGIRRVRRRFDALSDLATLPERGVVNALGLGARDLLGDAALVPVRGQLVHLAPQALPYLLSHEGYLFPRRDALVLGGTVEWNVAEARVGAGAVERILGRHRQFFRDEIDASGG